MYIQIHIHAHACIEAWMHACRRAHLFACTGASMRQGSDFTRTRMRRSTEVRRWEIAMARRKMAPQWKFASCITALHLRASLPFPSVFLLAVPSRAALRFVVVGSGSLEGAGGAEPRCPARLAGAQDGPPSSLISLCYTSFPHPSLDSALSLSLCLSLFLSLSLSLSLYICNDNNNNNDDNNTYIYIYIHTHTYIYIYIERERDTCIHIYIYIERERDLQGIRMRMCTRTDSSS